MRFILLIVFISTPFKVTWAFAPASEYPGGSGTVTDSSPRAFSHPLKGTSRTERREFFVGNSFFRDPWVTAPASTEARDGLGPVYNAVSCGSCHNQDGRGAAYRDHGVDFSLIFRLSRWNLTTHELEDHPVYGEQLNPLGVGGVPGEGSASVVFQYIVGTYPDGEMYKLRRPLFNFSALIYGALSQGDVFSARVAPQVIGLGLVENIDEVDLLKHADEFDVNADGISGRPNYVTAIDQGMSALGRFGWKANQPSVRQQVAGAFLGDMGLTSSLFPRSTCLKHQTECVAAPSGGEPEVEDLVLERVVTYSQLLAVPKRRNSQDPEVVRGSVLFKKVSCNACHVESHLTGTSSRFAVLNNQLIWPYSDFLLHDMGPELADHRPDGRASGSEWRTPPLWGIGLIPAVNGHSNLLHDGRAEDVEQAILWHGGEAQSSIDGFKNLPKEDRQALIKFVNDL